MTDGGRGRDGGGASTEPAGTRPALDGGGAIGAVVLGVGVVLIVGFAVWAWIHVPQLYPPDTPGPGAPALPADVAATDRATRAQSIVTTRASVLAALAGLGALITIAINYRNSQLNARTLATTQNTFRVTERGHLTDRYTKAIEQLGDKDSIAIRLGGIYALQQLAVDTNRDSDQATVVEVLSAFVRLNLRPDSLAVDAPDLRPAPAPDRDPPRESSGPQLLIAVTPAADVLAAISVLAQLPARAGARMRADFTGLDFTGLALAQARLVGANLTGTNLVGAVLAGAVLVGANLSGATVHRADFTGANLRHARLTRSVLSEAGLRRADLTGANLSHAALTRANLLGAVLTGADLTNAVLTDADLTRVTLTRAALTGAFLAGADLHGANLTGTDLTRATLFHANLTGTNLTSATLTGADLTDATLTGANLTDATLTGTTVSEQTLAQTVGTPRRGVDGGEPAAAQPG